MASDWQLRWRANTECRAVGYYPHVFSDLGCPPFSQAVRWQRMHWRNAGRVSQQRGRGRVRARRRCTHSASRHRCAHAPIAAAARPGVFAHAPHSIVHRVWPTDVRVLHSVGGVWQLLDQSRIEAACGRVGLKRHEREYIHCHKTAWFWTDCLGPLKEFAACAESLSQRPN